MIGLFTGGKTQYTRKEGLSEDRDGGTAIESKRRRAGRWKVQQGGMIAVPIA